MSVGHFCSAVLAVGVAWTSLCGPARANPGGNDGKRLVTAFDSIHGLELDKAEESLSALRTRYPSDADVLEASALLAFHRGDYKTAAEEMRRSIANDGESPRLSRRRTLSTLFDETLDTTKNFGTRRSADGRFTIAFPAGKDEVLVPYALVALESADKALKEVFGFSHPGPVRVDFFPSSSDLGRVSTLTKEQIETTGTIALCKWDRLMVTSPRALVRGYSWMDTISHEYVHLILSRVSKDRAPVWLQEGVAKFLERRWRKGDGFSMPAYQAKLLTDAAKENALIPFDKLHPSIAALPSQKDASLAYAQVASMIELFVNRYGEEGLRQVVFRVAGKQDAREALAEVAGMSWNNWEQAWREHVVTAESRATGEEERAELKFKPGGADTPGTGDEAGEVANTDARKHLRLGNLLWGHGRHGAASVEYGKAYEYAPDDPIVASRYARTSLKANRPKQVLQVLRSLTKKHPGHAPARALLGEAFVRTGQLSKATQELFESIWINPFDPAPHCLLAEISSGSRKERESVACQLLGGYTP